MISGSHDSQTSADVYNTGKFQLPDPQGRAGGACTSALLKVLYNHGRVAADMSWVECLRKMRTELNQMGFSQVPQLTSSRLIDVNTKMRIVPPGAKGRKRALLIGINYKGQQGELRGCHNDVLNVSLYCYCSGRRCRRRRPRTCPSWPFLTACRISDQKVPHRRSRLQRAGHANSHGRWRKSISDETEHHCRLQATDRILSRRRRGLRAL